MSEYLTREEMLGYPAEEISDSSKLVPAPVVSVCITAYNHEKYIAEAIDRVIRQKRNFPMELLIGEDCSSDRTREICAAYQRRYPEIIRLIISETNVGGHKNFFRIQARARGQYLALCDGDDFWTDDDKLNKQTDFLEMNPGYSFSFHNAKVCYENSDRKWHLFNRTGRRSATLGDLIEKEWFVPTASVIFRHSTIPELPGNFNTFPSGDIALEIILASKGRVRYFDEAMSVYRKSSSGASFEVNASVENGIKYWRRFIDMMHLLDAFLGFKHHRHFIGRILRAQRRISYMEFRYRRRLSPRVLVDSFRFQLEEKLKLNHF